MKILKEPALISWKIEKECSINKYFNTGCGALLEIESADIYLTSIQRSYWSESAERYIDYDASAFAFKCPCCGAEIIIND